MSAITTTHTSDPLGGSDAIEKGRAEAAAQLSVPLEDCLLRSVRSSHTPPTDDRGDVYTFECTWEPAPKT